MQASALEIRQLTSHAHTGVALRAAWEPAKIAITQRPTPAPTDGRAALSRFVGFIEGRLQLPVPEQWEAVALSAKEANRGCVGFREGDKSLYHRTPSGLYAPVGTVLEGTAGGIAVTIGDDSYEFNRAVVALLQRKGTLQSVNAHFDGDRCIVAFHSNRGSSYTLYCFDRRSSEEVWSSSVWASGIDMYTGVGFHCAWLVVAHENVFVFGASDESIYIEAFDVRDGENTFRFSTAY
jgi:hypothetical protein